MNQIISVKQIKTPKSGSLSFFEASKDIPFEIKRIYYVYDTPVNTKRGMHAHKSLNQVLWCPHGVIEVVLDNGKNKKSHLLDSPSKLLLVGSGIWHDMYWKEESSILCVAASDFYCEDDYIRDYNEFLRYVKKDYWNGTV